MQLRFYAKENLLAYVPSHPKTQGQPPPYLGRMLKKIGNTSSFPATEEPHVVEVNQDSPEFMRYSKLARAGAVWPADDVTARACGVALTRVKYNDGVWTSA